MKKEILTVEYNREVLPGTYHMRLSGDTSDIKGAGQFIDVQVRNGFLRRPISIYDYDASAVEILYKVVGKGTDALSELGEGDAINALVSLGNGFDLAPVRRGKADAAGSAENGAAADAAGGAAADAGKRPVLVGGGIGMPPVYLLAKEMKQAGLEPNVVLGFRSGNDILPLEKFEALGVTPLIVTEDGTGADAGYAASLGASKGLVTDALAEMKRKDPDAYDYVYCCGPSPMLYAVLGQAPDGQFSFEERMGCGFGACMGCSLKTKNGYKRICKDGPVLYKDEILPKEQG